MHALEVIIARNAYAAGRALGHADTDRNRGAADAILRAASLDDVGRPNTPFTAGYIAGREEG